MQKDNNEEITVKKETDIAGSVSVFLKDEKAWFLYKRSEKISKVFFLLTRHLSDDQVLKSHIRIKALDLMSKAQLLLSKKGQAIDKGEGVVLEALSLISLSDTAYAAELQSQKNHEIIVKELESFIHDLSTWAGEQSSLSFISSAVFEMSDVGFKQNDMSNSEQSNSQVNNQESKIPVLRGGLSGTNNKKTDQVIGAFATVNGTNKGDISRYGTDKSDRAQPSISNAAKSSVLQNQMSDMRKNNRQEAIIKAIEKHGEVSIKDLVSVVKGCSEKTIQRELILLVSSGVLLKTGERRWSRYSIISN